MLLRVTHNKEGSEADRIEIRNSIRRVFWQRGCDTSAKDKAKGTRAAYGTVHEKWSAFGSTHTCNNSWSDSSVFG